MIPTERDNWIKRVAGIGLGNLPTFFETWRLAEDVLDRGVSGDFAEAGVFAGAHPAIMARVLMERGVKDRRVHLFDSFCGIPKAGPRDAPDMHGLLGTRSAPDAMEPSGVSSATFNAVQVFMRELGVDQTLLLYHAGWFRDTLPVHGIDRPLAFLRIDADLYDSTVLVMRHLHPLVPSGGIVIVDDWGLSGCRAAIVEHFALLDRPVPEPTTIPGSGTVVWWREP